MPRNGRRPDPGAVKYGERQDLESLAQSFPTSAPPGGVLPQGPGSTPQPGPSTAGATDPAARLAAALAAAQANGQASPIGAGLLSGPTKRPNEPQTAGLSTGPGPGPEALGINSPVDPDLVALAPFLPTLELMSSLPNSSVATRNFIRRLRAIVPRQAQR